MQKKHDAKVDVSVLILFFNRPHLLKQVFQEVKKARPARLFLYQDGPRGERDMEMVKACREVVDDSQIDWECVVERKYQERNFGCDPSGYMAHTWAFSKTDKCIVFEDDIVPSQSFFPFCKELLDRYENDPHVWMIAGFNALEKADVKESYFFTQVFSIWGWASWRRVIDTWDAGYSWLEDKERLEKVERTIAERGLRSDIIPMSRDHKASGKAYFESIFWSSMLLNDGVAIMTAKNQINNIGVSDDSTHFQGSLKTMPRRLRRQFIMPRHEMEFPLAHPEDTGEYTPFKDKVYLLNAWNNPARKVQYSIEELFLNLRYGNFSVITKALRRRIRKWMGKEKFG